VVSDQLSVLERISGIGFRAEEKRQEHQGNRTWIVLKGHDFSRAARQLENFWASAPEG
jgi:hypothetical protein